MDNKYSNTLTKEVLLQALKRLEMPLVTFEPLEKYLAEGGKMSDTLTMVTASKAFEDIKEINTIHGILKVQYSPIIPHDKIYFMNPPKMDDWLKPNFKSIF